MKNKKGFTLVELLAVVVILAIIIAIAVPSTMSISTRLKKNMFCSKIDLIETAAMLYGEDRRDSFNKTIKVDGTNYKGVNVTIEHLVDTKYLKKDHESKPYIEDPRDKNNSLDAMKVSIYIKNNRVYIRFDSETNKTCGR